MTYTVTVRYGDRRHAYHTFEVEGAEVRTALREAAAAIPDEVAASADLVELRRSVDAEDRAYVEG